MFTRRATTLMGLLGLISLPMQSIYAEPQPQKITSTLRDQQQVAVTIYQHDFALVKDQRKINLVNGFNLLTVDDVSSQMLPESARLMSLSHRGSFNTLEQNYAFDLLSPDALLHQHIGRTVSLIKTNPATGLETTEKAIVLSTHNGIVLKIGDRIETTQSQLTPGFGRIVFTEVPENLRTRPTFTAQLNNKTQTLQTVELSYLTRGLTWQADYIVDLNAKEDALDLSALITLQNTSGTDYQNAKLQVVAGNVHIATSNAEPMAVRKNLEMMMDASPTVSEASISEYHLYTLERPTTLKDNQSKQVSLFNANQIPARKELVLRGAEYYYQSQHGDLGANLHPSVYVSFDNNAASQLGVPMPKGTIRMYKKDTQGNSQFVGEDQIQHTAKNTLVRLKLGEAFDVTADKKQTSFTALPKPSEANQMYDSVYEIRLSNAKKEAVDVTVQEPISGDWQMLNESHPHKKVNSQLAEWKVTIPAGGVTTLTYAARVKY